MVAMAWKSRAGAGGRGAGAAAALWPGLRCGAGMWRGRVGAGCPW